MIICYLLIEETTGNLTETWHILHSFTRIILNKQEGDKLTFEVKHWTSREHFKRFASLHLRLFFFLKIRYNLFSLYPYRQIKTQSLCRNKHARLPMVVDFFWAALVHIHVGWWRIHRNHVSSCGRRTTVIHIFNTKDRGCHWTTAGWARANVAARDMSCFPVTVHWVFLTETACIV